MGKYNEAFNEVDLLMNEMLGKLNITIDETNLYPTEDIFRMIVREIDVENLKALYFVYYDQEFQTVIDDISPNVRKFMFWWEDNLDYGAIDIQALIAKKEGEIISPIILVNSDKDKNKKRI
ncbi:hypothetical protein CKC50_02855 [Salmonella enterica]|nr:hypothetical protein [Salmonella enterica]EDR3324646.1 hypothetical protein [Salmonella enterica subsp. enterica serovar Oslo]EDV7710405.1 hypothetical protein [Salmonella enterica subsp. enterica serovar Oslo]EDX3582547.1 hypothetical protein [Salmonella enterica subsp. enterica serovar Oslo]EHN7877629.1 hypothetical protein [Salmonella enterica]